MQPEILPYLVPFVVSFFISVSLAIYTWRERKITRSSVYGVYALLQALWVLFYTFELLQPALAGKIFWDAIQWIVAAVLAGVAPLLALHYIGRSLTRWLELRLFAVPVVFLAIMISDGLHHFIYPNVVLIEGNVFDTLDYPFTWVTWGLTGYIFVITGLSVAWIGQKSWSTWGIYRGQAVVISVGLLIPLAGAIAGMLLDVRLLGQRDLSPLTFALSNIIMAWALFRWRGFDISPIWRDKILDQMSDGMIVIDMQQRIIDINAHAQQNASIPQPLGRPLIEAFPEWAGELPEAADAITTIKAKGAYQIEHRVSPIYDANRRQIGRLLMCRDVTAQIAAEIGLRESEARFKSAFENVLTGMTITTLDGHYIQVNQRYCDMLGYSEAELLGMTWRDVTYPADIDRCAESDQRTLAGENKAYSMEKRYQHRNGKVIYGDLSIALVRDEAGEPMYFVSHVQDITQRKATEEALKKSEQLYRLLAEHTSDMVALHEPNGQIVYGSPAYGRILGYSSAELMQLRLIDLLHPEERAAVLAKFTDQIEQRRLVVRYEKRFKVKAGDYIWVELYLHLVLGENGEVTNLVSAARNITARRAMQDALQRSEELYRLLADNTADMVALHDPDGRYIYASPSYERNLGYTLQDLQAIDPATLVHPDDLPRTRDEAHQQVLRGETIMQIEYRFKAKSGQYVWVEAFSTPLLDDNGRVVSLLASTRIATTRHEKEQAEREALRFQTMFDKERELSQLKTQMMVRVGHEFRTPLTAIRIAAEILDRYFDRMTPAARQEKFAQIYAQMHHLTEMLDTLNLIVRGPSELRLSTFSPADLCRDVLAPFTPTRRFDLHIHIAKMKADMEHLTTLLHELVSNAVNFSPDATTVVIEMVAEESDVLIHVNDTGIGIPNDEQYRLFEPFFRGSNIGEVSGLGLGLAVVQVLARLHGGDVEISSTTGQTCVTVRLKDAANLS